MILQCFKFIVEIKFKEKEKFTELVKKKYHHLKEAASSASAFVQPDWSSSLAEDDNYFNACSKGRKFNYAKQLLRYLHIENGGSKSFTFQESRMDVGS